MDPAKPQKKHLNSIGSLVSQLISRRGYAQIAATDRLHAVIVSVVGEALAEDLAVGKLNRGVLRVYASDSVLLQELTFQKRTVLKAIQEQMPEANVTDLRFAVQPK